MAVRAPRSRGARASGERVSECHRSFEAQLAKLDSALLLFELETGGDAILESKAEHLFSDEALAG